MKIIIISKETRTQIDKLELHDAEVSKIICDYDKGTLEMPIIIAEKDQYAALLKFEDILHIEINRREPWGAGIYIFEVNVDDAEGDAFKVSILLNSGDEFNITASKMIYLSNGNDV